MRSIQIERRNGESDLDFHRRLIYGKLVDKTLSEIDFTELAKFVYGQPYASDVARRMMYGSCKTLALIDKEDVGGSGTHPDILKRLEAERTELQKERQRLYDQRREYKSLVNLDGRREHLYEALIDAANHLNETVGELNGNPVEFGMTGEDEAVLVLSDWHYGMTASNIFNTYDTDICKQRVSYIVNAARERILLHRCRRLHIAVLGDMYHGAIHTSARVASEELVCDQLMQVSEILAQAICGLSDSVSETYVYMTYGNHARTVQNKHDSIHRDNMERIIPWWLEQRLRGCDNITIVAPAEDEFVYMSVCNHDMCAVHGDLDNVKASPRLLPTLFQKKYGCNLEYILLGDKHHSESFSEAGVTAMLCGSLCGTDDYANDKRLYSVPSQLLLIMNQENGVDAEYRIKCK